MVEREVGGWGRRKWWKWLVEVKEGGIDGGGEVEGRMDGSGDEGGTLRVRSKLKEEIRAGNGSG